MLLFMTVGNEKL